MINKFSRKELERLNCSEEEVDLVLKYQKKLPILVGNNTLEKFSVDARLLWEQLDKPQGDFSHWVKRKIVDKIIKGTKVKSFVEVLILLASTKLSKPKILTLQQKNILLLLIVPKMYL